MKEVSISIRRAIQVQNAFKLVENSEHLEFNIAYWMGRLNDTCTSIAKPALRQKEKLETKVRNDIKALSDKPKGDEVALTEDEVEKRTQELLAQTNEAMEVLLDHEEPIKIFSFAMEHFIAKDDFVLPSIKSKDVERAEVKVKKGQLLVPVKFFSLMGDLVGE